MPSIGAILALAIIILILLLPLWVSWPAPQRGRQKEEPTPETEIDETSRLQSLGDKLLKDCIETMKEDGVPISSSISPSVTISRSEKTDCQCRRNRSKNRRYDFTIALSKYLLSNTERSLRNTLYHELIHTVPGAQNHKSTWRKWAKFVSEKLGYDIQRNSITDETPEDLENLREGRIGPNSRSREEVNRLLADCRAQLLALGVPISKSICPEVQMSRARHGFGWCRDNTSIDQYKYEYSLVLSRSVLSRPVPEIRRIICQELQKTIDNQG